MWSTPCLRLDQVAGVRHRFWGALRNVSVVLSHSFEWCSCACHIARGHLRGLRGPSSDLRAALACFDDVRSATRVHEFPTTVQLAKGPARCPPGRGNADVEPEASPPPLIPPANLGSGARGVEKKHASKVMDSRALCLIMFAPPRRSNWASRRCSTHRPLRKAMSSVSGMMFVIPLSYQRSRPQTCPRYAPLFFPLLFVAAFSASSLAFFSAPSSHRPHPLPLLPSPLCIVLVGPFPLARPLTPLFATVLCLCLARSHLLPASVPRHIIQPRFLQFHFTCLSLCSSSSSSDLRAASDLCSSLASVYALSQPLFVPLLLPRPSF